MSLGETHAAVTFPLWRMRPMAANRAQGALLQVSPGVLACKVRELATATG
ncbi:hypothetical protein Pssp01_46880 [Pseudomonas sp. NBRC 100443]|nr:hypothetical protein Pssp01_46880 [Pseudomonas sp. NBRC 100443]